MSVTYQAMFHVHAAGRVEYNQEFSDRDLARAAARHLSASRDVTLAEFIVRDGKVIWLGEPERFPKVRP